MNFNRSSDYGRHHKLLTGYTIGDMTHKIHLDGYNQLSLLTGTGPSARDEFFYFSDDGDLMSLRFGNWKTVFEEQRSQGTLEVWAEPLTRLRVPKLFYFRTDPFERADTDSNTYWDWYPSHEYMAAEAQIRTAKFIATFKDYPPRQKAASFSVDQIMQNMTSNINMDND